MIAVETVAALALLAIVPAVLYNLWHRARVDPPDRGTIAAPQPLDVAPRPDEVWRLARAVADGVRDEYAAYLFDPVQVFRHPLLSDVAASTTGEFLDALAAYTAAEHDGGPVDAADAHHLYRLARALRSAWVSAYDRAQIVGLGQLPGEHRERVQRAIKALQLALDPATTDAERHTAYGYALRLVEGIIPVHDETRLALEQPSDRPAIDGPDHHPPDDPAS